MPGATTDRSAPQSVVLVGFMAAGKSRIGRGLAERLELPFVDCDAAIEAQYGSSVAEIFHERGEAEFRAAERALIARLLDGEAQVIALGGGAFADPATREALNRRARTVWLDTPFGLILARLKGSPDRPLAADKSEAELRALWHERAPHYAEAQIRIDTTDADPRRIADRIVKALGLAP